MADPERRLVRCVLVFLFIAIGFGVALLLYSAKRGIPFVEGDTIVTHGRAYGFQIGMSREECLAAVRAGYDKPDYYLRVLWPEDSPLDDTLRANHPNRHFGEYRSLIGDISGTNPPLDLGERWDIEMPAAWVNDIYLTFDNDRLIEIRRSRWVFERP